MFFCLLAFTVFFSIVLVAGLLAYGVLVFIVRRRCACLARCASAGIYRRARRDSAFERQLLLLLVACMYFFSVAIPLLAVLMQERPSREQVRILS